MPPRRTKEALSSRAFRPFVAELTRHIHNECAESDQERVAQLLNGAASDAVRVRISKVRRAGDGIFFSGHDLANAVATKVRDQISDSCSTVFDPTCGAGDLLLAAARLMPLEPTASQTVRVWSERIGGCDLHYSFVEATRRRLVMLALDRHRSRGDIASGLRWSERFFPQVVQADYLASSLGADFDCVLANPPFADKAALRECTWSSGKTQVAAFFVEHMVQVARIRQRVVAVLPDVLRSGTRYGRWRAAISLHCEQVDVYQYGRFDAHTDVDVFLLDTLRKPTESTGRAEVTWTRNPAEKDEATLGSIVDVSVGSVVPHRHEGDRGPWCLYIDVTHAERFGEIQPSSCRRFQGRTVLPPFVVVRRTSSPGDSHRIVPTLVTGNRPVAVENHLLVLKPKSGQLESCRRLMAYLTTDEVGRLIDSQIRCRHLTVAAVRVLPAPGGMA